MPARRRTHTRALHELAPEAPLPRRHDRPPTPAAYCIVETINSFRREPVQVPIPVHSHRPPADACWCDKEASRASARPARMAATSAAIAALFCFSRALSWVESQA
jgi:hypothetical protein